MSVALVVRTSTIMLLSQAVARAAGLATFMVLTRFLTVGEVGTFGYAVTLVGFLTLAVDFGFDLVVTRETARDGSSRQASLAIRLKTPMFAALYPALVVAAWLLAGRGPVLALVALLGAAVWHESANRSIAAHFLARGRAEYGFVSEVLASLLRLTLVPLLLLAGARVVGVGVGYVAASLVTVLILVTWAVRHGFRLAAPVASGEVRRLFSEGFYFALYGLLFQAYFRIDVILLGVLRPAADVGEYVAAFRVIEVLLVVPAVLTGALYPVLSRLDGSGDHAAFRRGCAEATRRLSLAGCGLALIVGVAASPIVRLVAGPGYEPAAAYLPFLVPTFALICLNCVSLLALNAVGRQRMNVRVMFIGAATKLAWDLLLIPQYGPLAACVGSVVTEVVVTASVVRFVRSWYSPRDWWRAGARPAAAAVAGLGSVWLLSTLPLLARLGAGVAIFAVVAIAAGAVRRDDVAALARLWRARAGGAALP
jgi:O-antigen/teichoic acid export membrane protein